MRLLILDDDAAIGRLLARVATPAGFTAEITTDAAAFQKAFEAAVPDLVALDLQLGQSDGIEQLRYLSSKQFPNSVILLTGFDSRVLATAAELARNQGLQLAAALGKPIDVPELRSILAQVQRRSDPISRPRLALALENDEIFLEYQPIVATTDRRLHRLEALARWKHPDLGRVEPGRFIAVAEESPELAMALTERVITIVARDQDRLNALGLTVPVAVNLSPRCLLDLSFTDDLLRLLQREGMPPDRLCLEVTESAAFDDALQTMDILTRLRLRGIRLALDDFGTGYSSFKLLSQMPFTALKIERSFVANIARSPEARAIVKSLVDVAEALHLESIAEGVETGETAAVLEELKVGFLQGYLIGRPVAIDQITNWAEPRRRPAVSAPEPTAAAMSGASPPVAERIADPQSADMADPPAGAAAGGFAEARAPAPTPAATPVWRLDSRRRELRAPDGSAVRLTGMEFETLAYLEAREGEVVSRDEISTAILHRSFTSTDRSVDNLVAHIRMALKPYLGEKSAIKSVRGQGYVFVGFDDPD